MDPSTKSLSWFFLYLLTQTILTNWRKIVHGHLKNTSEQQWLQLIRMSYICLIPLTFKIRRICRKKNVIKAMHFIRINEMFFFQLCMYLDVIWMYKYGLERVQMFSKVLWALWNFITWSGPWLQTIHMDNRWAVWPGNWPVLYIFQTSLTHIV